MTDARLVVLLSLLALFSSTIAFKIDRTPQQRAVDASTFAPISEQLIGSDSSTNSGRDAKNKRCCCCCSNCCFNPCCCSCNLCCWLPPSDQFYSSRSTTFNHETSTQSSSSASTNSWNSDSNPLARDIFSHRSSPSPPTRPPISFVASEGTVLPHPTRPPPIDSQPIRPPPIRPPTIGPSTTSVASEGTFLPHPTRPPHMGPPPYGPPHIDPPPFDHPPISPPPIGPLPVRPPTYTIPSEDPTSLLSSSLLRVKTITEQRTSYERQGHYDRNCNSRELREILVQCIAYNPSESKQRINAAIARQLDGSFGIVCTEGAFSYLARVVSYLAHTTQFCHLTRHNITCLVFRESES